MKDILLYRVQTRADQMGLIDGALKRGETHYQLIRSPAFRDLKPYIVDMPIAGGLIRPKDNPKIDPSWRWGWTLGQLRRHGKSHGVSFANLKAIISKHPHLQLMRVRVPKASVVVAVGECAFDSGSVKETREVQCPASA